MPWRCQPFSFRNSDSLIFSWGFRQDSMGWTASSPSPSPRGVAWWKLAVTHYCRPFFFWIFCVWLLFGWFHIVLSLHFVSAVLIPSMYPQYLHIFTHTSLRTVFCASFFVSFDSASVQNVHEHFLQCEDGFVMTAMAMTEPRICLSTHAPFTPFLEHVKTCPWFGDDPLWMLGLLVLLVKESAGGICLLCRNSRGDVPAPRTPRG